MLNDLRVVELGDHPGMKYAGKIFADMGAAVSSVRFRQGAIEEKGIQDKGRSRIHRAHKVWLNTNKIVVEVDPTDEADVLVLQDLIRNAAIVLDARPLVSREGGDLSLSRLRELNPDAQTVSVSDFGDSGPYKDFRASDGVIRALNGMIYPNGPVERPMMISDHQSSIFLGLTVFNAAMSGILSGAGHRWDVNSLEAGVCFADWHVVQTDGYMGSRIGLNRFTSSCPSGSFACKDGWIGGTANTFPQWLDFCQMFDLKIAHDSAYATSVLRAKQWGDLSKQCVAHLRWRSIEDVRKEILERKLPLAVIPSVEEIVDGEVGYLEGVMETVSDGDLSFRAPAIPFKDAAVRLANNKMPAGFSDQGKITTGSTVGMPLSRLRVLDLSMGWAGPLVTRQLGDLGALIVKVEACRYFDWWRGNDVRDAFYDEVMYEKNAAFIALNRNKTGIAVDLTTPEGVAIIKELVKTCDIVVENYARDVLPKLGLDYSVLSAVNPRLVMLSMAAFPNGFYDEARAYGSTLECASGLPAISGRESDPPVLNTFAYGDACGGLNGLGALLAALYHRDLTGEGAHIQLSQVQAMLPLLAPWIIERSITGKTPARTGNRSPDMAPNGIFRCRDDDTFIYLSILDDAMWVRFVDLTNIDVLRDAKLAALTGRRARESEIESAIESWTLKQEAEELMFLLQRHEVAAGVVRRPERMIDDPQLVSRGFWQSIERPITGISQNSALPMRNGSKPFPIRLAAPALGQFNNEVLRDLLGLSSDQLKELKNSEVIGNEGIKTKRKVRLQKAAVT